MLPDGKLLLTDCRSSQGTAVLQGDRAIPVRQEFVSPTDTVRFGDMTLPVKDLLESIRLKFPGFNAAGVAAPGPPPESKKPWVKGSRLQRCPYCGAVREKGGNCEECGA